MTLLVFLLAVGVYKLLGWHFKPSHDQWFFTFGDWLGQWLQDLPRLSMLLVLLIPLCPVAVLLAVTSEWLFGLVGLLLQAIILVYALARANLFEQLQTYLGYWRSGNQQSAFHHAEKIFSENQAAADDSSSLHAQVCRGFLKQWFEQVFVIVFWFLLAGPLAALFVRLLSLYEQHSKVIDASQLLYVLEWLPLRLLGLTFAIVGNFALGFKAWLAVFSDWAKPSCAVLFDWCLASIGINEQALVDNSDEQQAEHLEAVQSLLVRSLVVWMIVVALLTIF